MKRHLDGAYFRVKRNGKWDSVCFSDLTDEEMDEVMKNRDAKWLKTMCKHLGKRIATIGQQFDIVAEEE